MNSEELCGIFCGSMTVKEKNSDSIVASMLDSSHRVEICVVIGGSGICRIIGEAIECREGDMFIFGKGIPHGFFVEDERRPPRILSVAFSSEMLEESEEGREALSRVFKDGMPYSCSVLNSAAMVEICRLIGLIRREIDESKLNFERAARSYLLILLINLERYLDLADTLEHERSKEWPLVVSAMGEVMKRYWESDLTLGTVSDSLFVSQSRLSRAFFKATGERFPDYLRSVRIKAACTLLERSEMTNEEIAHGCGFRDLQTFYNAFKKSICMTPKKYRELFVNKKTIYKGEEKMVTVIEISEAIQKGRAKMVKSLVEQAIGEGLSAEVILNEGLIAGMTVVGERFKRNEVFVPEVLVAARAMNMGIEAVKPMLENDALTEKGRVCIGTVRGDLHDIGKNLVKIMLESRGLEVIDLGVDVAPEKFVEVAKEQNCQVICCSALLTTTMPVMEEVVKAAEAAGIRESVKIMVGGAPVSQEYCDKIGADCYTVDATSAAEAALNFCRA